MIRQSGLLLIRSGNNYFLKQYNVAVFVEHECDRCNNRKQYASFEAKSYSFISVCPVCAYYFMSFYNKNIMIGNFINEKHINDILEFF